MTTQTPTKTMTPQFYLDVCRQVTLGAGAIAVADEVGKFLLVFLEEKTSDSTKPVFELTYFRELNNRLQALFGELVKQSDDPIYLLGMSLQFNSFLFFLNEKFYDLKDEPFTYEGWLKTLLTFFVQHPMPYPCNLG